MNRKVQFLLVVLMAGLSLPSAHGQAVEVTARFDTNRIALGGSTFLRVYAEVVPALKSKSDRIFSWYVDILNSTGDIATANYDYMTKPTSDNDPSTSSTGKTDGAHRHGIYDTFLNLPGAGVSQPVELMTITVTGHSPGTASFQIAKGTHVPSLEEDFIVAASGGGDFFSGGDYSIALADLEVLAPCDLQLKIRRADAQHIELNFDPCPGFTHTIETRSQLIGNSAWQSLADAPHDSGKLVIPNPTTPQFFRVRREVLPP